MKLLKQMGKDSQSEKLYFYINRYFSYATVDKLLLLFPMIFPIPTTQMILYIIQLFSDHLNPTLVIHLRFHLSVYPIKHLFWFFVSCSNQSFTVQISSPHKCDKKSGYSAFNAVVAVFPQIFWAFSHSFQIHKTRPPLLSFLEGSSSC